MKKIFALFLAAAMVFSVFGCSKKKKEEYPYIGEEDEAWKEEEFERIGLGGFLKPLDMTLLEFDFERGETVSARIGGEEGENVPNELFGATCEEIKRIIGENGELKEESSEKTDSFELYRFSYTFLRMDFSGYVKYNFEKYGVKSYLLIKVEKVGK